MIAKPPRAVPMRIRDWQARFERNRTRELAVMTWRPEPTDLSDDVYTQVIDDVDGAAHYGILTVLRNVAARGKPRGTLTMEDSTPHTAQTLARKTRLPEKLIEVAIQRLLLIGELEKSNRKSRIKTRLRPQEGAGIPQEKRQEEKTRHTSHPSARAKNAPRVGMDDRTKFQQDFEACLRAGKLEIPEEFAEFSATLSAIAEEAGAEASQAAVLFLDLYHRAHHTGGVRDGKAYLIAGFKSELAKQQRAAS